MILHELKAEELADLSVNIAANGEAVSVARVLKDFELSHCRQHLNRPAQIVSDLESIGAVSLHGQQGVASTHADPAIISARPDSLGR